MEQHHDKVNVDITQIRPHSSDLYGVYRPTGTVQTSTGAVDTAEGLAGVTV